MASVHELVEAYFDTVLEARQAAKDGTLDMTGLSERFGRIASAAEDLGGEVATHLARAAEANITLLAKGWPSTGDDAGDIQ